MRGAIVCITFVLFLCYSAINGNGILKSPVNRSSMWRYFGAASYAGELVANRQDTSLNCGGNYIKGNSDLASKCGLCGDPVKGPYENEYGTSPHGVYATGHKSAVYQEGSKINVTVSILKKQRGGFFMLYLCKTDATTAVTESCFQQNRLTFPASINTPEKLHITDFEGDGSFEVQLPTGVTCDDCVMRWVWITANEYRCDPTGLCGIGYWDQPTYVNCADVKILSKGQGIPADFEYPDYQSLYSSLDGNGTTTMSTTPGLTNEPIVGTTTASPITIVTVDPSVTTGTTDTLPNTSRNPLVGPVAPIIGAVGGGLLPSLGFFAPLVPFAGIAGLGLGWFGKGLIGGMDSQFLPPPPGPIVYRPVEFFGGPTYIPSDIPHYRSYNAPKQYNGYGSKYSNNYGYRNENYANNNYGYTNVQSYGRRYKK